MRVRDEAHRFAVTYHRTLRKRRTVRSVMDEVAGVGPARRRLLLREFGSAKAVAEAGAEEIVRRTRLPHSVAERIVAALRGPDEEGSRDAAQG